MKTKVLFLLIFIPIFSLNLLGQTPIDAQHPFSQIMYSSTPLSNQYGIAWFQAVTLQNNQVPNGGYISVDYIKLIEEDTATGIETVLYTEDYNGSGALTLTEGGLFSRFPTWFDSIIPPTIMTNSNKNGGYLRIDVGQQPSKVNHFWGVRQFCTYGKRHKVEIRLLISGDIALQAGMDYWTDPLTTTSTDCKEAFYSNWYGNSNEQYITIKYPEYGMQTMFDRNDYGFYQNGKFYLSKNLVDYVGGSSVALLCDVTGWQPTLMTLNGNFYEYNTGYIYSSSQYYCFKINPSGSSFFVPHAILTNLVYPSDAVDNGQGGYNFYTSPLTAIDVTQYNEEDIRIYPNPVTTELNIAFKGNKDMLNFEILNSIGQVVFKGNLTEITIVKTTDFASGVYLIKLENSKSFEFKKIVKE